MEWNRVEYNMVWGGIERAGFRIFRGLTGIGWGGWCRNGLEWIGMGWDRGVARDRWDTVDWRQMCRVEWGEVEVSQNGVGGLAMGYWEMGWGYTAN